MEGINKKKEFLNSFEGFWNIISERKLHKNKVYYLSTIIISTINIVVFLITHYFFSFDYFPVLSSFVTTFLPILTTFCGFSMTAYSLVVGFLNYGVFKSFLEKWYRLKIIKEASNENFDTYTVFQKGIALFTLAIILLIFTVFMLALAKFIIGLEITIKGEIWNFYNAFILFILSILSSWCFILVFFNIINIFTFSQSINKFTYTEEMFKNKGN